jgi:hypothetical protein
LRQREAATGAANNQRYLRDFKLFDSAGFTAAIRAARADSAKLGRGKKEAGEKRRRLLALGRGHICQQCWQFGKTEKGFLHPATMVKRSHDIADSGDVLGLREGFLPIIAAFYGGIAENYEIIDRGRKYSLGAESSNRQPPHPPKRQLKICAG